jgi:hypothetical protein
MNALEGEDVIWASRRVMAFSERRAGVGDEVDGSLFRRGIRPPCMPLRKRAAIIVRCNVVLAASGLGGQCGQSRSM